MLELKAKGKIKGVIVTGCLAERDKDQLLSRYPDIDELVGVFGREEITTAASQIFLGLEEQRTFFRPAPSRLPSDAPTLPVNSETSCLFENRRRVQPIVQFFVRFLVSEGRTSRNLSNKSSPRRKNWPPTAQKS